MTKTIRFDLRNPRTKRLSRLPEGVDGDKSLMMWKELCRTGQYVTDGENHDIDEEFFRRMIDSFQRRRVLAGAKLGACTALQRKARTNKKARQVP